MKRGGGGTSSADRRGRKRRSRPAVRRRTDDVDPSEPQSIADMGWVEWGCELIWAVGFTAGGAPYGLQLTDFDPEHLQAMGLNEAALTRARGMFGEPDEPPF
jgi:hypothetical protein